MKQGDSFCTCACVITLWAYAGPPWWVFFLFVTIGFAINVLTENKDA